MSSPREYQNSEHELPESPVIESVRGIRISTIRDIVLERNSIRADLESKINDEINTFEHILREHNEFIEIVITTTVRNIFPSGCFCEECNKNLCEKCNKNLCEKITKTNIKKSEHVLVDTVCAICLDSIEEIQENGVVTKCGHMYHSVCISKHIDTRIKTGKMVNCPLCRTEFKTK